MGFLKKLGGILWLTALFANLSFSQSLPDSTIEYYPNGAKRAIGRYENGMKSGFWYTYFPDGSLNAKENFVAGQLDGTSHYFYPQSNGGKMRSVEIFRNGIPSDSLKEYHPNGQIARIGFFDNGLYEGVFHYFYPEGMRKRLAIFHQGKPDQSWELYDALGRIQTRIHYLNGLEEGTVEHYRPDGSLEKSQVYRKGVFTGTECLYNRKGELRFCLDEGQPFYRLLRFFVR